jgi:hypothetical protein
MSLLQTFPPNFEFKRLIPLEKIKIADISIILERSQKCVIDKIVVKMLGKNQNGTT